MRYRAARKARFRSVASHCRVGVEPTGLHRKVSVRYIELPPFPGLSWRYQKKLCALLGLPTAEDQESKD